MTAFTVVIPARYASSRLPGKPLQDIAGKPMVQRVWEQAKQSGAARVVVATDDERILEHVLSFGGEAVRQVLDEVEARLTPFYGADCPVVVGSQVSGPHELVLRGTLADIADQVEAHGLRQAAVIIVGWALEAEGFVLAVCTNKVEAHAVALLVSGGHTSLLLVRDLAGDVELLARAHDHAGCASTSSVLRG